ncbi:MAG TPA: hypothetical protein VK569_10070 [Bacteroidota bacterium]|nr:hypothetical protein [Bacteroidota bacterium]
MNRFVKSGSRLVMFMAWVFAATMFADAANLDDIFSSNYVIHDDDAASAPPGPIPVHDTGSPQAPAKSPPSPVRLILDQDSPSLAADSDASSLVDGTLLSGEKASVYEMVFAIDGLHIKLRSLLI